ncbi:MarR family transcriptional regulator [Gammaproteobacteria bacterium LSUCC0057]|uniref:MarR family transcriptional regulator n=1 Tax=Gammaproteobacteria bacterium LSUCC0057 TaxID=2559237 RepID=A0A4Y8UJR1_9GAMM|nr:MarR family transcriptional regulator [Gammaproteobacteria bacterium LSUCC0057]
MDSIDQVLIAVRRVIRATDLQSKYLVRTTGLTTPQILILHTINAQQELTIGQLAKAISLSQATVTTIIDRLESRQLISRIRSASDKRKVYLELSDAGRDTLSKAPPLLQEQFIRQFSALAQWEQSMIIASLQRVAEMMDAQHIDASPVLDIGTLDRPGEAASSS